MKIKLLDFQVRNYHEWANELNRYSTRYNTIFEYRCNDDSDLTRWLEDADIILYHLGEARYVDLLIQAENPDCFRRTYIVFSDGENLGDKQKLESICGNSLLCIGRAGLRTVLPELLFKAASPPKESHDGAAGD